MNYLLSDPNWLCRVFGHSYGKVYRDRKWEPCEPPGAVQWNGQYEGPLRRTCALCGHTEPAR